MNLPPLDVPGLLKRYNLHPNKKLGQNFLVDPDALETVVDIADLRGDEAVLEIGPGLGSLTRLLAVRTRRVVGVELDARLMPVLKEVLKSFSNVELVQGDILALDPGQLMDETQTRQTGYQVVANIPYYITSVVIRHLLEAQVQPQRLVMTVQREVAERITAAPGDMSLLAISVQVYGVPQVAAYIPAGAFYPPPQVDSAVVRIDLHPAPLFDDVLMDKIFLLAKAGFSQKRKNLRNALSGGLHYSPQQAEGLLQSSGIDPRRRAETLSLEEWGQLAQVYK
jgi:16S rRNA (adenine1518-N6/adenine1519-N6)-dimethyltransferase